MTTPNPTSGTLLATPLGDTANLSVAMRRPGRSCSGCIRRRIRLVWAADRFINAVHGERQRQLPDLAQLSEGEVNQVGTWHWKAAYSGDAKNNTVTSPCASEPVEITQPVLTIAKTPDSGTITAGATATFTIVVTNNGPGVAKDVAISDPLPAAGDGELADVDAGLHITGAVGSQTLNCSLGTTWRGRDVHGGGDGGDEPGSLRGDEQHGDGERNERGVGERRRPASPVRRRCW